MHIYGNALAHIMVSLAADFCAVALERALERCETVKADLPVVLRRSYFGSPMVTTMVSREVWQQRVFNHGKEPGRGKRNTEVPAWVRATGCPITEGQEVEVFAQAQADVTEPTEGSPHGQKQQFFLHAYSYMQGPSYAFAKMLQNFRAAKILGDGCGADRISFHHGPPTKTVSVMGSAAMREFSNSFGPVKPLTLFEVGTVKAVMLYLLLADVVGVPCECERPCNSDSHSGPGPGHPLDFQWNQGSFHGGLLTRGFDIEQSRVLQGLLLLRSKLGDFGRWIVGGSSSGNDGGPVSGSQGLLSGGGGGAGAVGAGDAGPGADGLLSAPRPAGAPAAHARL